MKELAEANDLKIQARADHMMLESNPEIALLSMGYTPEGYEYDYSDPECVTRAAVKRLVRLISLAVSESA